MPLFSNAVSDTAKMQRLLLRMIKLREAVQANEISDADLKLISGMTVAEIADEQHANHALIKQLIAILTEGAVEETTTIHAKSVEDALEQFAAEHDHYLPLTPLATDNHQTLAVSVGDFAKFYAEVIQFITLNKSIDEMGNSYNLDFDHLSAKTAWIKWKNTRTEHLQYDVKQNLSGLLEKYLAGQLHKNEWLTDIDLERAIKNLGLSNQGIHILPFSVENIGLALHFARQQHEQDAVKQPYCVPMILNVGMSGNRIDSRGQHWTRLIVTVDPRQYPPKIAARYEDDLILTEKQKAEKKAEVLQALAYLSQTDAIGANKSSYVAFPECVNPPVMVIGSGAQKDGFTCGYRALRGITSDLIQNKSLAKNEMLMELVQSNSSTALRDFIYRILLSNQTVENIPHEFAGDDNNTQKTTDPERVNGLLLAFKQTKNSDAVQDRKTLLALVQNDKLVEKIREYLIIRKLISSATHNVEIDMQLLLNDEDVKKSGRFDLVIEIILTELLQKKSVKTISMVNDSNLEKSVLEKIKSLYDRSPPTIQLQASHPELSDYLKVINARNRLIAQYKLQNFDNSDLWDVLFEKMLFTIPDRVVRDELHFFGKNAVENADFEDLGVVGFHKFLEYLANNQSLFNKDLVFYNTLRVVDSSFELLRTVKQHLQSTRPFLPFTKLIFEIKTELNEKVFYDELTALLLSVEKKGITEIKFISSVSKELSQELKENLRKFVTDNKITTVFVFNAGRFNAKEITNLTLENARIHKGEGAKTIQPLQDLPKISLGKLGHAIYNAQLEPLDSEIQVQQQVQQQIQTPLADEDLPDEDDIIDEIFENYAGTSELIDRAQFIKVMPEFIQQRHPHLKPEECWDMLFGTNADKFKNGILKISMNAAKMLVDHLEELQYGFHPDNLPYGFILQKDGEDRVVLDYAPTNPPFNPNQSPLTIRFRKPALAITWAGNALQFISLEKAQELFEELSPDMKKSGFDNFVKEFMYLRELPSKGITPEQRQQQQLKLVDALTNSTVSEKIRAVFKNTVTHHEIVGLFHVFYEQGLDRLHEFLDEILKFKQAVGEEFFVPFKECFFDPTVNLNDLANPDAYDALHKLQALTVAQKNWWLALTKQHTSNLRYQGKQARIGNRSSHFSDLAQAFIYFCDRFADDFPDLHLPLSCPLTDVADMRVGLDRLLTILSNAHDLKEQFIGSLPGLSLDTLGPFYASRYEGFKWVDSEMQLTLGALSMKYIDEVAACTQAPFCFQLRKNRIIFALQLGSGKKKLAWYLRAIATFNQRAPVQRYLDVYNNLMEGEIDWQLKGAIYNVALGLIAKFGTGKRGKNFTDGDIQQLVEIIEKPEYTRLIPDLLSQWSEFESSFLNPTVAELVTITTYALEDKGKPAIFNNILLFFEKNKSYARAYFETLLRLKQNPKRLNFDLTYTAMSQIYLIKPQLPEEIKLIKLLAICTWNSSLNAIELGNAINNLVDVVKKYIIKHGPKAVNLLLELFSSLDLAYKPMLPTLERVTEIIEAAAELQDQRYMALEDFVRIQLPGCKFVVSQVDVAPTVKSSGLLAIIANNMSVIYAKLIKYETLIKSALGPQGEVFFQKLLTFEGPQILFDALPTLKNASATLKLIAGAEIKTVMLDCYNSLQDNGVQSSGLKDPVQLQRLKKIFESRIEHPIRSQKDFELFLGAFGDEYEYLENIFKNVRLIFKKWPEAADVVLIAMEKEKSPSLSEYTLATLAKITELFAEQFDKAMPFPKNLFTALLKLKNPSSEMQSEVIEILQTLFDPNQESTALLEYQKQQLCEVVVKACQNNPGKSHDLIQALLAIRIEKPELFNIYLQFLKCSQNVSDDFSNLNREITHLNLPESLLKVFAEHSVTTFFQTMETIQSEDEPTKKIILQIVAKILQNHSDVGLKTTIKKLLALKDLQKLGGIAELFTLPKIPKLNDLNAILAKQPFDLQAANELFDRDPFSQRTQKDWQEQFSVQKLPSYLDQLVDLNYATPLLLTKREELQRWFLYLNVIGKDKPILINPTDPDAKLAIYKMSHHQLTYLIAYYRTQLQTELPKQTKIKCQLELIAILREVMFRTTGKFPRPNQILYLLLTMQSGKDMIAEIATGEGKSMTSALQAAFCQVQGWTVDVCTTNQYLAKQSLSENQDFFNYLGMTTRLIHAGSPIDVFADGGIHYSSMSECALVRSKAKLQGKIFPKKSMLISDEVDFSTLDDNTRYRYAATLDPVQNPYESPYIWIYEALIEFVDKEKKLSQKTDNELLVLAKNHLINAAKGKQKLQLLQLTQTPDVYQRRLEQWLMAAGKTASLIDAEEKQFRIVKLEHATGRTISKACILVNGRPQIQAEYSDAVQQFLHMRLRKEYSKQIESGPMPNFLVEPEKVYITSLNSKILIDSYEYRLGMTGTVGSKAEIKEQFAKYGFRFFAIPQFAKSKRRELRPVLTSAKWLNKADEEEIEFIDLITKAVIKHRRLHGGDLCSPLLIQCADKNMGNKIASALAAKNISSGVQKFYSSEEATAEERNAEENEIKTKAGQLGSITISSVFSRGTDIIPVNGLTVFDTFVDTLSYSAEDLERSRGQKAGRSGRAGQIGYYRLFAKRSEFFDIKDVIDIAKMPATTEALNQAITALNAVRNKPRVSLRHMRESFDDLKDFIYQNFLQYLQAINEVNTDKPTRQIRDVLLKEWNGLLSGIDEQWQELSAQNTEPLNKMVEFAVNAWNQLAATNGPLRTHLQKWSARNQVALTLPQFAPLETNATLKFIHKADVQLPKQFVKRQQLVNPVDETVSVNAIYCDMNAEVSGLKSAVNNAKIGAIQEILLQYTPRQSMLSEFAILFADDHAIKIQKIAGTLLYLQYKAYQQGNPVAYSAMQLQIKEFTDKIIWTDDPALKNALANAQKNHFEKLTNHQGQYEMKKDTYLARVMRIWQQALPMETTTWKVRGFNSWWNTKKTGMREQMTNWLTNYKNNWWERGWVSGDRKDVVNSLLSALNQDQSPNQILAMISKAKQHILANDSLYHRAMESTVSSRLYEYLEQVESRVLAAIPATSNDTDIQRQFSDIQNFLNNYAPTLGFQVPDINPALLIDNKQIVINEVIKQYHSISAFMQRVLNMNPNDRRFAQEDWRTLFAYCEKLEMRLVNYFGQSHELIQVLQDHRIQLFRAATKATTQLLRFADDASKIALNIPKTFKYQDYQVICSGDFTAIQDHPFFKQVNTEKSYHALLATIERELIQATPSIINLEFESINLSKSEKFPQDGFKLRIHVLLNGQKSDIDYHFDLKNRMVYNVQQPMQMEANPALHAFTLDSDAEKVKQLIAELTALGANEDNEIRSALAEDNKVNIALLEGYAAQLKGCFKMGIVKLSFTDYVKSVMPKHDQQIHPPQPRGLTK